jgi:hypothetical protein
MKPVKKSRSPTPRPVARRWGLLLPAAVVTVLAGCTGDYGFKGDPFLGGQSANRTPLQYAPRTSGDQAAQAAAGEVPPLPATHSLTSPAALAGGTTPTPENPRDLRIPGGAAVVPASMPGGGTARGVAPGGGVLDAPQPVQENTALLTPVASTDTNFQRTAAPGPAVAASSVPPAGALSFEQAQLLLKQHGVTWQRLETWGDKGQWKFRCSIPNPSNPSVNRWFETTKPLPSDPLTAVRAVIEQIQKEQR